MTFTFKQYDKLAERAREAAEYGLGVQMILWMFQEEYPEKDIDLLTKASSVAVERAAHLFCRPSL